MTRPGLAKSASCARRRRRGEAQALLLLGCSWLGGCSSADDVEAEQAERGDARGAREEGGSMRDAGRRDASRDAASPLDASTDATSQQLDAALRDASLQSDAAPKLHELVETFFVPTCVLGRCHTTLAPAGDLSLTDRNISVYDALVNAPSSEVPERMRVVPHDPAASYLMEKLESDSPAVGTRMPPPFAVLPQAQIERVRAWILAGALRD